jgi:hypothetical protein
MGKLLRTKKCDSGVIGLKPKLERIVSKAQGRSLWIRKVASFYCEALVGIVAPLAPANTFIIKRRLK